MNAESKSVEKLCGFYVSEWHLVTMILPYINRKIDEKAKIITILENETEENIKTLVEKLNLKNAEEILRINWRNMNGKKYKEVQAKLDKEIANATENIILINGTRDYIDESNINVTKWKKTTKAKSIKIIDLYEVTEFNTNIQEILNCHDKILNTSGEKEIEDVFDGYVRHKKAI